MDPLSATNTDLVSAIQALLVRQGSALERSALMALLGQDVEMLFQTLTPEGAQLKLPSGQIVTAQGELPYPEGTQLRVRILASPQQETSLRLQLLEARPPALPALLSPLVQSEAQTLATRLSQDPPAAELAPLLQLLSLLSDPPERPSTAFPVPTAEQLQAAVEHLPSPVQASLARVLGTSVLANPREVAATLLGWIRQDASTVPTHPLLMPHPEVAPPPSEVAAPLETLVQQILTRFQALVAGIPELPEKHREALTSWLRNLLQKAGSEAGPEPLPGRGTGHAAPLKSELPARLVPGTPLISPRLTAAVQTHPGPKAELPESWESWIRGTVQTLSDPGVSPREAVFHALQAKENTAFFEIPLPWAQASPLQIWVESDAPEERREGRDTTKRVLLGLRFSHLGETRLGLAQDATSLHVRIWTEHPEPLEPQRDRIETELQDLGKQVDLRIFALTYRADGTIPSVRSLAVEPSLSALG